MVRRRGSARLRVGRVRRCRPQAFDFLDVRLNRSRSRRHYDAQVGGRDGDGGQRGRARSRCLSSRRRTHWRSQGACAAFQALEPSLDRARIAPARRPRTGRGRCAGGVAGDRSRAPPPGDTSAFAAWAYRITSRRCAKLIGRAVRERRTSEALRTDEDHVAVPEPDTLRLRQAIETLPPDQRAAIALFYLEDMSVAEVAVALAVPAGTVKTRLMHARHKLRAALEGDI